MVFVRKVNWQLLVRSLFFNVFHVLFLFIFFHFRFCHFRSFCFLDFATFSFLFIFAFLFFHVTSSFHFFLAFVFFFFVFISLHLRLCVFLFGVAPVRVTTSAVFRNRFSRKVIGPVRFSVFGLPFSLCFLSIFIPFIFCISYSEK